MRARQNRLRIGLCPWPARQIKGQMQKVGEGTLRAIQTIKLMGGEAVRWGDLRFVPLLRAIAVDAAQSSWLWMSNRTGAVFAPYDGGADLFLPTAADAVQARSRWAEWLLAYDR